MYRWLVVSKKFRKLIEGIVDENAIQYLSTKLIDTKNNAENTEYRIANLLDVVDALDLEHSQYDLFELDNEKIISERIRNIIENNSLMGFAFIEVEVY